jgi:copper oxidase (laccase) domain-containing protein
MVSAVHAGWRGLAGGVLEAAVQRMTEVVSLNEIEAVIGPAAGKNNYEVGSEVIEAFGPICVAKPSSNPGKSMLDMEATAAGRLHALGIPPHQVAGCGVCTIEDGRFCSYRREPEVDLRNLAFILPFSASGRASVNR